MGNVDHVVVGPVGVFALETKNWSGRITRDKAGHLLVNGRRPTKDPGAQARRNAMAVSDLLKASVISLPVRTDQSALWCMSAAKDRCYSGAMTRQKAAKCLSDWKIGPILA